MIAENLKFTEPKICDCGGDITKQWYVYYNCTDVVRNETKQFRHKLGINKEKDLRGRRRMAKEAILAVKELIYQDGFNPFDKSVQKDKRCLLNALTEMYDLKKLTMRKRSKQSYIHAIHLLREWLKERCSEKINIVDFSKTDALKFADWLLLKKKYAGKSTNAQIGYLKTMMYMLVERNLCTENPFTAIKKLKEAEGRNVAFTPEEIALFLPILKKKNKRLYYLSQFIRYCFIRKTELIGLKVRDINLQMHTISISSEISKTGKQDSVTIPKSLEKIIEEMDLMNENPNHYIFGAKMETCSKKLNYTTRITEMHRELVDSSGLRKELILYGWKHTGCVELYNLTKDPYVVCRQCRHSDIRMTMRYLRSLGLGINESVRDW